MTDKEKTILEQVKPYFLAYKKNLTLDLPHLHSAAVQEMWKKRTGNYIAACGSCWINALTSLLIESGHGTD